MKIAIVDDLATERISLHSHILTYFNSYQCRYTITPEIFEFESGEAFLQYFKPKTYDLVFLDIYMSELTGIDVATRLITRDSECNIIFFTTSMEHILDGYDVNAIGYILKPVTANLPSLYKAINRVIEKMNLDNMSLEVSTKFGEHSIFYRNITFLECITRSAFLHTVSDIHKLTGKYGDFSQILLEDNRFLECYRNLIVNMDYIEAVLENDFLLKTGETIPISRRKKTMVKEKYTSYFIGRNEM